METATFNIFLIVMAVTALIVFIALHFVRATVCSSTANGESLSPTASGGW